MMPLEVLKKYWGYDSFRPMQAEIVDSALSGADTLGLLPTGGGKSITFQVPGLLMPGLTIVVTPLISLMKDQVDNLRALGIPATYIHSGLTAAEVRLGLQKAELGKVKFLYLSPERLKNEHFRQRLRDFDVSMIVVDEAHCISQWGYDFRPSYLHLAELRKLFPRAVMMALTASATPAVVDDITRLLEFRPGFKVFRKSFARPNISYIVRYTEDKPERLLTILQNTAGSAIVYVRSRRKTREIAETLIASGIPADYYHAGLAPEDKDLKQQRWKDGESRVMVATNAFGMGIDKPDVRVVVHYDLPSSIEEYYQEAGRAGRDGKPCFAVVIASAADKAVIARRLSEAFPPREYIADIYEKACLFIDLALGEGFNKVFDFDFGKFVKQYRLQEGSARSALRLLSLAGYIDFVEEVDARARLMMIAPKHELYSLQLTPEQDEVLQYILRNCSGVFADYVQISETVIATRLQMTADAVYHALLDLTRIHALHYIPRRQQPFLFFPSRRIQAKYIEMPRDVYDRRRDLMKQRLDAMKRFVFDPTACRANIILEYFDEQPSSPCGSCDNCRATRRPQSASDPKAEENLIKSLADKEIELRELVRRSRLKPEKAAEIIRRLLDRQELTLTDSNRILCKHP
ncbi:MAG: RecQ family ATP-dependent DNA helicase [Muribaculaceae bacterium]|nr:RecQ family ATP-dependent DNA helicase [Muribaculaceae bacterium]